MDAVSPIGQNAPQWPREIETMDDGYGGEGSANIPAWGHESRFVENGLF